MALYDALAADGDRFEMHRRGLLLLFLSVAEAQVFDKDDVLVASGRGVYLTAPPKP